MSAINPVDGIVVAAIVLSGILALIRGLVREILSLVSWSVASVAGVRFAPLMKDAMLKYTDNDLLALGSGGFIIFLVVLITLTIISHFIAKTVRNSSLSAIDRSLGFIFGALRGFLVAALIYMAGTLIFTDSKEYPDWLTEAKTQPALAGTSDWLTSLMPADIRSTMDKNMKQARESAKKAKEDKETLERLSSPQPGRVDHKDETLIEKAVKQAVPEDAAPSAAAPSATTAPAPATTGHIRENNGKQ